MTRLVYALCLALVFTGCDWLGYTAYVGTWELSYQDVDSMGDPIDVTETLQLSADTFTLRTTTLDMLSTETWNAARGDLTVVGNTFYFTTREVGFDLATVNNFVTVLGLEGKSFDLPIQEWYDVNAFLAEMSKGTVLVFPSDVFELGNPTFTVSGDTLTIAGKFDATYEKQ